MIKLNLEEIRPGMRLARSIVSESGELLLSAGNVINERVIGKMKEIELSAAWIAEEGTEIAIPEETVNEQLSLQSQFVVKENSDMLRQVAQIKTATQANIKAILADASRFKNIIAVEEIKKVIKHIMEELLGKEPVAVNLNSIRTKSGYNYQHALDVAVTAILLATKLKYTQREIEELALGCLLMDLGMVVLPASLLNKQGQWTEAESNLYREHPALGYAILRQNDRIGITTAHVAYQHHERQDGKGYPRGLRGDNQIPIKTLSPKKGMIHRYAEIAAVADAYISMLNPRPGTVAPQTPDEAMRLIIKGAGTHLNRAVVDAFITIVPAYPVGSRVVIVEDKKYRKYTGYSGVVARTGLLNPEKPVLLIIFDREKKKIKPWTLDMAEEEGFKIQFARLQ
ncbi:MAG: HD domain-containing protein [Fibrobacteres bacterium]|jgi:HD-GYP domain-containing protein (c-di-GMP phosphodiesterase class II)|nr:HD domain-containing protein [Fibrobacterota bacterium]